MDVIQLLKDKCEAVDQITVAKELKISAQYLNDVLQGRRLPGKKILTALGFEKRIEYIPLKKRRA